MMTAILCRLACPAYLLAALLTFGIAASRSEDWAAESYKACTYIQSRTPNDQPIPVCNQQFFPPAITGAVSGILWPFYWTWEIVDDVRGVRS